MVKKAHMMHRMWLYLRIQILKHQRKNISLDIEMSGNNSL